jgi:predicted DCC family thiol-disulfide oxidoreductase YuxK
VCQHRGLLRDIMLDEIKPSRDWPIEVFYDGACPLCLREIRFLKRFDRKRRIRCTDIASSGFPPAKYGKTLDTFMAEIHGRLPDGSWLSGVEVFRLLYTAVGLGPLVWATRLPGVSGLLDWGHRVFARNRLRWTGRCSDRGGNCGINTSTTDSGGS